jgi:hypothetical protein
MVSQTFAADPFAAAGFIGAVASFEVLLSATFIHARLRLFASSAKLGRIKDRQALRKRQEVLSDR